MNIEFGKYKGKCVELLFFNEPNYIKWILKQRNTFGVFKEVQGEIEALVELFDKMDFQVKCDGKDCCNYATYCTVYETNVKSINWWCSDCNPRQLCAIPWRLHRISKYKEVLEHADIFKASKSDYKQLMRTIGEAKGLPLRLGEKQAVNFFDEYEDKIYMHLY